MNKWLEKLKHAKGIIVAVAGGGAVLSGLVGYYTTYQTVKTGASSSSITTPALVNTGALSIVVLPFANQTGDAQKGYIADALTTSITADLSRIRDAFVISSATAFTYKDKPTTTQQIGKEVGARFALQGSVLASSDKLRIHAQLADTQTGAQLWSETFDGEIVNLFALQDQVTAKIGNSIGREMVLVAARESEKRTTSPQIADLMMRARALAWKPLTLETFKQREDLYRQVIARDTANTAAPAELAVLLISVATNFATQIKSDARVKMFQEADQLALKVEAIDPQNPLIYRVLTTVRIEHHDVEGAKRAAMRGLELNPKDPVAYNSAGIAYLHDAKPQIAAEYISKGINLDPKNPPTVMLHTLGCSYFYLGKDAAAIEWLTKAIERSPKFPAPRAVLAAAYLRSGETEKAKATATELLRINPEFRMTDMAQYRIAPKLWEMNKLTSLAKQVGLPE